MGTGGLGTDKVNRLHRATERAQRACRAERRSSTLVHGTMVHLPMTEVTCCSRRDAVGTGESIEAEGGGSDRRRPGGKFYGERG